MEAQQLVTENNEAPRNTKSVSEPSSHNHTRFGNQVQLKTHVQKTTSKKLDSPLSPTTQTPILFTTSTEKLTQILCASERTSYWYVHQPPLQLSSLFTYRIFWETPSSLPCNNLLWTHIQGQNFLKAFDSHDPISLLGTTSHMNTEKNASHVEERALVTRLYWRQHIWFSADTH